MGLTYLDSRVDSHALGLAGALAGEQLADVVESGVEDGALVLVVAGDDLGELVDAFVDCLAAAALDCGDLCQLVEDGG